MALILHTPQGSITGKTQEKNQKKDQQHLLSDVHYSPGDTKAHMQRYSASVREPEKVVRQVLQCSSDLQWRADVVALNLE